MFYDDKIYDDKRQRRFGCIPEVSFFMAEVPGEDARHSKAFAPWGWFPTWSLSLSAGIRRGVRGNTIAAIPGPSICFSLPRGREELQRRKWMRH